VIKIIPPGSFSFDDPVARLVDLHSRGVDKGWMSKRAAVLTREIADLRPEPGHSFIHLITMGAQEAYGFNRNGDGFPEKRGSFRLGNGRLEKLADGLMGFHDATFMKYGHVFKHHCFPAGTQVTKKDHTTVPIETVSVGDEVKTHRGAGRVVRVMRNAYVGAGTRLTVEGRLQCVTATEEHPVLVYRRSQIHCCHKYSRLNTGTDHWTHCREIREEVGEPAWVPVSSVRPGDYLVQPAVKHGRRSVPDHFAELVGWVASEGYVSSNGTIAFSFSDKNTADIAAVKWCLSLNGLTACEYATKYNTIQLSVCNQVIAKQLRKYIAGKLNTKRLLPRVLTLNRRALLNLLGTYVSGDGCVVKKGRNDGQLNIRSSSPAMLRMLELVVLSLGLDCGLNHDCDQKPMVSPTNGKTYMGNGSGVVSLARGAAKAVALLSRKWVHTRKSTRLPRVRRISDHILRRVTEVETIALDTEVFNLEVENDHTYLVEGLVVHNCNDNPAKSIGTIKAAAYNPEMRRGELIIKVPHNLEWEEDLQKLASGRDIAFSMACKVANDMCTECGNRARTRKEYCDHLTNHMSEITKEGNIIGAINDAPAFFDISKVFRPADRIAWSLQKVASLLDTTVGGAELAEMFEISEPTWSPRVVDGGYSRKLAAAHKLAEIEKQVDAMAQGKENGHLKRMMAGCPTARVSSEDVGTLKQGNLNGVLCKLADTKILLDADSFFRLVMGQKYGSMSDSVPMVEAALPGLYNQLAKSGELSECAEDHTYDPSDTAVPRHVRDLIGKLESDHSLAYEPTVKRATVATLRGTRPLTLARPVEQKQAAVSKQASSLAREYVKYVLSFVKHSGCDDLTDGLTVLCNYTRF
jgi:hypothetical protein